MRKNRSYKIKGVKPFNEFFFKNCYWHQLIAGLSCLGIDAENVLVNSLVFPKPDFEADKSGILSTREFEKFFGYRCKPCGLTEYSLIRRIDKDCPVIVGVDCYFLESRIDTYRKLHDPHFILIYGYDCEKRLAYAVDHEYRNGFNFSEKVVSLDNILLSNKMYKKYIRRIHNTSRVIYLTGEKRRGGGLLGKIGQERLTKSRECSKNNLNELCRMADGDIKGMAEKSERITGYLQDMKTSLFCLAKAELFRGNPENGMILSAVINGYSHLLSLFWKMNQYNDYEFALKRRENILRKIDEINAAEERIYKLLAEVNP